MTTCYLCNCLLHGQAVLSKPDHDQVFAAEGAAHELDNLLAEATGQVGTSFYIAPEVARGGDGAIAYDEHVDVFSIGAALLHMGMVSCSHALLHIPAVEDSCVFGLQVPLAFVASWHCVPVQHCLPDLLMGSGAGVIVFELWHPFGTGMERVKLLHQLQQDGALPAAFEAAHAEVLACHWRIWGVLRAGVDVSGPAVSTRCSQTPCHAARSSIALEQQV